MKFEFFFTLLENSLKNFYKIQNWYLFLHKPKRYIISAAERAIIDFLTRLLQKVINKRLSWSSTFFFTLLENSLKNLYKIQQLASISTQTQNVLYHGNKEGYHRFSNSPFSKSYWQTFFMKFDFFFTLLESSLKNLCRIQKLAIISTQI